MLIKVLHREKVSENIGLHLDEFPNNAFELIPIRCSLCWKLVFSVLVLKDKKYHNTRSAVHWNFTHNA